MAKGRYQVMIDTEAHDVVAKYLRTLGMTFSGLVNGLICELSKEIKGQPVMMDKKLDELTLKEFGELASYWMKTVSDVDEEEKR